MDAEEMKKNLPVLLFGVSQDLELANADPQPGGLQ